MRRRVYVLLGELVVIVVGVANFAGALWLTSLPHAPWGLAVGVGLVFAVTLASLWFEDWKRRVENAAIEHWKQTEHMRPR